VADPWARIGASPAALAPKPGDFGRMRRAIARRGLIRGLKYGRERWLKRIDRAFDRRFGVETEGAVSLDVLGPFDSKQSGEKYIPLNALVFLRLMSRLPFRLDGRVFVDIGAGKGRAVMLASLFAFERVVGVEHAPELHAIFERNVGAFRRIEPKGAAIDAIFQDATLFPIPAGDCVLFFHNPLKAPALRRVVANIAESYRRNPRRLAVVFLNPAKRNRVREIMSEAGIFRVTHLRDPVCRVLAGFPTLIGEAGPRA
jgi:SAM-dependent methyltransferase